ncbi:MAG: hypothetical protein JST49_03845 [Bacteroidetes bacterium]|nr:hypothetical protein [Bacteroidota bacterium]
MKYTLFCLTLLVFTFSACKKDDDKETILDVTETNVKNTITDGSWFVSKFDDGGFDETSYFVGYNFNFTANYEIVVTKTGESDDVGEWETDFDSDNRVQLYINFHSGSNVLDTENTWYISELTNKRIVLKEQLNANNSETLEFTKQ